jgi:hypothetical protein
MTVKTRDRHCGVTMLQRPWTILAAPDQIRARSAPMLPELWRELDDAVLDYLALGEASPAQIGERLNMSEAAVVSIIAMLASEGRVHISRVALSRD